MRMLLTGKGLLLLIATLLWNPGHSHEGTNNKLVAFQRSGAWEIWCIDLNQTGRVVCDLNQVMRYRSHPDFRALILRFVEEDSGLRMDLEIERQTSLRNGFIQVDYDRTFSLSDCGRPGRLRGSDLRLLLQILRNGEVAFIRIHDHGTEQIDVQLDLNGLVEGLHTLARMQRDYRSGDSESDRNGRSR